MNIGAEQVVGVPAVQALDGACCEEHFPSSAMTVEEQREHVCPVCSWSPMEDG